MLSTLLCSAFLYLLNATFGRLQAFRSIGALGMSASSLHRESTDSLMYHNEPFLHANYTSMKIIKSEVGCRDGTVPIQGDIRNSLRVHYRPEQETQ